MADQKDTAVPRFYTEPIENKAQSEKEGRPIFEDKEMVEVRMPGDRSMTWTGTVEDRAHPGGMNAKERWPQHYEAFKRNEQKATVGTPLEMWPQLTRARVAELKSQSILTVEEYADVPDNALPKIGMNARAEREKARAFLASAKDTAYSSAMAAENAMLKERLARLEQQAGIQPSEPETKDKEIDDCTDAELKAYIKRETGEAVRGNPSRETLLSRAHEVAEGEKAAA